MLIPIIGGALTFLVVFGLLYFYDKMRKPKHWSDGYVMLGNDYSEVNHQEPEKKQESGGLFPPGW